MAQRPVPSSNLAIEPTPGQMLRRGMHKRCARCGGGDLYASWFRMHERCHRCGVKFERQDGYFASAYIINFVLTEACVVLSVMTAVLMLSHSSDPYMISPALMLELAGIGAVLAPMWFQPTARTMWFALNLSSVPLEPDEIAAADAAVLRAME